MKRRIVFMGSDPIALPGLHYLDREAADRIEFVGVFTQPDRPAGRGKRLKANEIKEWALGRGIEVRQPDLLGADDLEWLHERECELILVMAYGHILRRKLIEFPRLGTYNLHTSLLPKYRGPSPIQAAVAHGEAVTGVTLMQMVRRLDAGPIVDQETFTVERMETGETAEAKMAAACVPLLARNLDAMLEGAVTSDEQDDTKATYTRKLEKRDGGLDFSSSAEELARRINALYPWPGCFVDYREQRVKIGRADWDNERHKEASPGTVLPGSERGLAVATGRGTLYLQRLQRPGGRLLPAVEFLRGFPVPVGAHFPSTEMPPLVAAP